jgi:replicative DNA helicase
MANMPLFLEDTATLDIATIKARIKWLVAREGVKIVYIDYLQLASGTGSSREQEISSISRGLKQAAKENNIPIVALSQLSRAVETRGGTKRPLLSDLRESGAIEQDADIVAFLYRPEYYGMELEEGVVQGATEFIVAKYRNGATGHIPLLFDTKTTSFTDYETPGGVSRSMPKSELFQ